MQLWEPLPVLSQPAMAEAATLLPVLPEFLCWACFFWGSEERVEVHGDLLP